MTDTASLISLGLVSLAGAAIGAALGGGVAGALKWQGLSLAVATGVMAATGLGVGVFFGQGGAPATTASAVAPAADPWDMPMLRQYYPADYARMQAIMARAKNPDDSAVALKARLESVYGEIVARQMPLASQKNAIAALRLARDEVEHLSADPQRCYHMVTAKRLSYGDITAAQTQDFITASRDADDTLLRQTAISPEPVEVSDQIRRDVAVVALRAASHLTPMERDNLLDLVRDAPAKVSNEQAALRCRFASLLYTELYALPDAEGARLYKRIAKARTDEGWL